MKSDNNPNNNVKGNINNGNILLKNTKLHHSSFTTQEQKSSLSGESLYNDKNMEFSDSDIEKYEGEKLVFHLQGLLQKQIIMLQKQQFQKVKFVKAIEQQLKTYYTLMIQNKNQANKIVKDDGFDNCYNFIKDIVVTLSRYYHVAIKLMLLINVNEGQKPKNNIFSNEQSQQVIFKNSISFNAYQELVDLCINVFYEGVSQTNPYLKNVTRLISCLLAKLPDIDLIYQNQMKIGNKDQKKEFDVDQMDVKVKLSTAKDKIYFIFKEYMKKQQIQDYFEIICNQLLKKISKVAIIRPNNRYGYQMNQSRSIVISSSQRQSVQSYDSIHNFQKPTSSFEFTQNSNNWLQYFRPFEAFQAQKKQVASDFLARIFSEADLFPPCLKIPLKVYCQSLKHHYKNNKELNQNQIKQKSYLKIWELIQSYYLHPLKMLSQNQRLVKNMNRDDKQTLEQIVGIIQKMLGKNQDQNNKKNRKCCSFILKTVQKIIEVDTERYENFIISLQDLKIIQKHQLKRSKTIDTQILSLEQVSLDRKQSQSVNNLQQLPEQLIKMYGGCISFKQLYILLYSLNIIRKQIPNQRIYNRVTRVFDMSPQLVMLKNQDYEYMYIILSELQYHELIQSDYHKIYTKQYQNQKIKSIIRQIICQIRLNQLSKKIKKGAAIHKGHLKNINQFQLQDVKMKKKTVKLPTSENVQKRGLIQLLKKISYSFGEANHEASNTPIEINFISTITIQKIKYLLWLFQKNDLKQEKILLQMMDEVRLRNQKMGKLYQHTKFGLLAVIGNIKHYKNMLVSKKQNQIKISIRVKAIKILENMSFNLCLTSPYSRSNPNSNSTGSNNILNSPQNQSPNIRPNQKSPQQMLRNSFSKDKKKQQIPHLKLQKHKQHEIVTSVQQDAEFNRYKYRISNADEIILCDSNDCIHRDNIFIGLNFHLNTVQQFIDMYSKLREVAQAIFFASFIINQQQNHKTFISFSKHSSFNLSEIAQRNQHSFHSTFVNNNYKRLGFSPLKINKTFFDFIQFLCKQHPKRKLMTPQDLVQFAKVAEIVIVRGLHEKLVKAKQNPRIQYQSIDIIKQTTENQETNKNSKQNTTVITLEGTKQKVTLHAPMSQPVSAGLYSTQSTAYQSKNDLIFIHQIRKLVNAQEKLFNYIQDFTFQQKNTKQIQTINQKIKCSNTVSINIKQIEQVCARYIKTLNDHESPHEKLNHLKNILDIYRLVVNRNQNKYCDNRLSIGDQLTRSYNISTLIFKSILIAEPSNFITNLAFIELFLDNKKLLSTDGKTLNQFKKVAKQIYSLDIQCYLRYRIQSLKLVENDSIQMQDIQNQLKLKQIQMKTILQEGELRAEISNIMKNKLE